MARTTSMPRKVVKEFGTSLLFNGSTAKVTLDTMGDFGSNLSSGISFSVWFKSTNTAIQNLFGVFNTGTTGAFALTLNSPSANRLSFFIRDSGNKSLEGTCYYYKMGEWNNLIASCSPGSNSTTFYLNGSLVPTSYITQQTPDTFINFGFNLVIGARNLRGVVDQFFRGYIDDFHLYNRAITSDEAEDIYYRNINPSDAIHSYSMNEVSGSTVIDGVGGINGTITAATYSTDVPSKSRTTVS